MEKNLEKKKLRLFHIIKYIFSFYVLLCPKSCPSSTQVSDYHSSHQLTTNQWNLRLKFCLWSPRQLHSRNKSLLPQTLHWKSGIYSLPLKCWACRDHGCPTHPQPVVVSPDKVLGDPEMTDSAVPTLEKVTSLKKKYSCSLCPGTCSRYTLSPPPRYNVPGVKAVGGELSSPCP